MRGVTSISITLLIIASSIAGCIETLEEVTEVLGCTDEGADNFDADATSGLEELCLYLENEVRFIAAMTDAMAADPSSYLLDPTSGVSGVRYSMSMDGVDAESGMSVSMELLSVIMVDLESQSMYNRSRVSYMGVIDVDTEIVMSGTDIMVTNSLGGPMASELGESGSMSSISRDMTPNLEEAVRVASMGFSSIMAMEGMMVPGGWAPTKILITEMIPMSLTMRNPAGRTSNHIAMIEMVKWWFRRGILTIVNRPWSGIAGRWVMSGSTLRKRKTTCMKTTIQCLRRECFLRVPVW